MLVIVILDNLKIPFPIKLGDDMKIHALLLCISQLFKIYKNNNKKKKRKKKKEQKKKKRMMMKKILT